MELIAVNEGDEAGVILKYVKQVHVTFPIAMNETSAADKGVPEKYGVKGYPTSYVLDGSGKVVWRGPSDPSTIRAVLEKMGIGSTAAVVKTH